MATRDNLTLSLNPGERETLNALAAAEGHRSLAALIRSRLEIAPPAKPGRPWPKPSAPSEAVASESEAV